MISKTQAEMLDALDQTYVAIEKDNDEKVVKATECIRCTFEALDELKQQASVNQKVNNEKAKALENERVAQEEFKAKEFTRMQVFMAFTLYYLDTMEVGSFEDSEEIEKWFKDYRMHQTHEITKNSRFAKYLKEVEVLE